ncbi:MAG: hypothetical protein ACYC5W_15990 [Thauera sp.]
MEVVTDRRAWVAVAGVSGAKSIGSAALRKALPRAARRCVVMGMVWVSGQARRAMLRRSAQGGVLFGVQYDTENKLKGIAKVSRGAWRGFARTSALLCKMQIAYKKQP